MVFFVCSSGADDWQRLLNPAEGRGRGVLRIAHVILGFGFVLQNQKSEMMIIWGVCDPLQPHGFYWVFNPWKTVTVWCPLLDMWGHNRWVKTAAFRFCSVLLFVGNFMADSSIKDLLVLNLRVYMESHFQQDESCNKIPLSYKIVVILTLLYCSCRNDQFCWQIITFAKSGMMLKHWSQPILHRFMVLGEK